MKKVMVQRLDVEETGSQMMALQIRDDEKLADGSRWQEEIIQAEREGDRVRLLFDNQRAKEREWITISLADWHRLHAAPHWRHVSWSPFITYERETLRGKAVLTHRDDRNAFAAIILPTSSGKPDSIFGRAFSLPFTTSPVSPDERRRSARRPSGLCKRSRASRSRH